MVDQTDFLNSYMDNLRKKINDLQMQNIILETKNELLSKTNKELLDKVEKLEKIKEKKTKSTNDGL